MRLPSVATAVTSSRKGGFRPLSMASLLSLTCRSGSCAMPLCMQAASFTQNSETALTKQCKSGGQGRALSIWSVQTLCADLGTRGAYLSQQRFCHCIQLPSKAAEVQMSIWQTAFMHQVLRHKPGTSRLGSSICTPIFEKSAKAFAELHQAVDVYAMLTVSLPIRSGMYRERCNNARSCIVAGGSRAGSQERLRAVVDWQQAGFQIVLMLGSHLFGLGVVGIAIQNGHLHPHHSAL